MNRNLTVLLVLAALGLSAVPANAFFEDVAVSTRSRGMGETGVATPDGTYATFLNPAHLAHNPEYGLGADYVRPFSLSYSKQYFFGAALKSTDKHGGFGISVNQFSVEYEKVDLLTESQVAFSYGHRLYGDLHSTIDLGASLNWYHVKLGDTISGDNPGNDSALGFDVGLLVTLHKRTRLGIMVKNLNNPNIGIDEEELPRRLKAGIAYEPYDGVITTFEIDNELGFRNQYHGGAEMVIFKGFALRAGIVTNPNKLTAGFGINANSVVMINYGFSTGGGVLENTHQFGVKVAWGGEAQ